MTTLGQISFGPLLPSTIGIERILDSLERDFNKAVPTYPPHNIVKIDDYTYELEIAVAGFKKEELDIEVKENVLTVKGRTNESRNNVNYVHKGIATRAFTRQFTISDTTEVDSAEIVDGILKITLKNIIDESKKLRKIPISNQKQLLTE